MVVEQGETLWLALASEGSVSMIPTEPRPSGLLEIAVLKDGKPIPYTYENDAFAITIHAGDGKATITHDVPLNALRVAGSDITLRFDGKSPAGVSTTNKPNGTEINIGGGKYFFAPLKGTATFDDSWILASFNSATPVYDIAPVDGAIDLVIYELPADTEPPAVTKTLAESIAANAADFAAFRALLYDNLSDELAYKLWLNRKLLPNGHYGIIPNRVTNSGSSAHEQAIASLAFKNGNAAIDVLLAIPEAAPPLLGYVAWLSLWRWSGIDIPSNESRRALRHAIERGKKWWDDNRHYPGGYYYAYRFETGLDNPEGFRDNGYAPDAELAQLMLAHDAAIEFYFDDDDGEYRDLKFDIDLSKYARGGLVAEILKEVQ
jgi:hypothetical protein